MTVSLAAPTATPLPIQVGPSNVTINRNDRFLVCKPDGRIERTHQEGFFARDTRFVSGWELLVNGRRPELLNSSPVQFFSARFAYVNGPLMDDVGPIAPHTIGIRVDRTILGGLHEDLTIVNYGRRSVRLTIEVEIQSDFADIFEVHDGEIVRRGEINTRWFRSRRELRTRYVNRDFERELVVEVAKSDSPAQFANGRLVSIARIDPKQVWHACIRWLPILGDGRRPETLPCSAVPLPATEPVARRWPQIRVEASAPDVVRTWEQAIRDIDALRLEDGGAERGAVIPAAGVPWFVTLFGRDSLIVSMQTLMGHPEFALGAIRRLSRLQATGNDPERDMEPGKIPHEIRDGELARLGILPFTPYYGTHDATSLFIITLARLHDWMGNDQVVRRYLPNLDAAMAWIDRYGDLDRDGFQEYRTRSSHGYYNQGWKDAGDAIVHADGSLAPLPIALVELQGYAYEAKLRLAGLYELVERPADAKRLRSQAAKLLDRFNDAFWWESEGTYYLGLDGAKKPIRSVASNPGHLLMSGIVPVDRAGRLVARMLAPDLWSGWGIRTLSSDHVSYNPYSYHTGTVWPHDNALIALGMQRTGHFAEAAQIARAIVDAAERFVANRLPELFAGLPRDETTFPVQYLGANVPQAWAAGCVIQLIATLAGIDARSDASGSRLIVSPALPSWLPELTVRDIRAGHGTVSLHVTNDRVDVLNNTSGFRVVATTAQ
jgi:glycogen debranching enzyme